MRFADLIDQVFGAQNGKCHGYPGHQEIELALVKLYHVTQQQRYLSLAQYFISQRGKAPNYLMKEREQNHPFHFEFFPEFNEYDAQYAQTHAQPVHQKTAEGHAVRALYMYSAMADLAMEGADGALRDTCQALYENIVNRRMYITGGIGSSGKLERFTTDYDLPNETMYCESCASVALMMFSQRMAELTGEASYYETVERALMNTVLGGIAASGDRYFYVNPLEVWPANCLPSTSMSHVKPVRQPWFACACCPPNIARTLASVGQYIYAVQENALCVNQFISSSVTHTFDQATITLDMNSSYMQDGRVALTATLKQDACILLKVRVPRYMRRPSFTMNGRACQPTLEHGYTCWKLESAGTYQIEIQAEVAPVFVAANLNVRADAGKVALMKGPFVYCIEETDNGANLANLRVRTAEQPIEAAALAQLPGKLPTLEASGERIIQSVTQTDALYGNAVFKTQQQKLKAIPYFQWCNREPGEMKVFIPVSM